MRKYNPCASCAKLRTNEPCWEGCEKLKEWNKYLVEKYITKKEEPKE